MSNNVLQTCEVQGAAYQNMGHGHVEPRIFCSCGFTAKGETWEDAGADYDAHLDDESE